MIKEVSVSDLTEKVTEEPQITKTASYGDFSIRFLETVLSGEIAKLVDLQSRTVIALEKMIEDLKKEPLNGGLD